jgi:class 3 adenylate cyclase
MDDVRAIMDEIGSERAAIFGFSEGAAMSALFAATYPERTSHLLLFGGFAKGRRGEDWIAQLVKGWGSGAMISSLSPGQATNPDAVRQFAKMERLSASPGTFRDYMSLNVKIDIQSILPAIRVPTLVLHRRNDAMVPLKRGRELAAEIPNAKLIEYPGDEHAFWIGEIDAMLGDVGEFVTGHRESSAEDFERILATVLFTDIVDSTRNAVEKGDQQWRRLLDDHDRLARQAVEKHRGTLIKSTGDGILATFDGPGRAVRCALSLAPAARQIGLPLRAGLHTGEIEIRGADIGGVAVHAAARVMAQSQPDEVLVSRVVTDLVAGAGLRFSERGSHELKGLPGRWDLFAASA